MSQRDTQQTERRPVRSEDPSLSPRANELLTREVQAAVGAEEVVVPAATPHRESEKHARQSPFMATLSSNRQLILVTFVAALVLGGIISMFTGAYWAVVLACVLHAVGTLVVTAAVIALTTQTEHMDPSVAARLEEEGVGNPDALLTDLVEEYSGAGEARGVPEVVSSGHNERTVAPEDDPGRSTVEQRTAMTPTSGRSEVDGSGSAVEALPWWFVGGGTVLSIVVAAIIGGDMWALPAVIIPIGLGWIALQAWMARGPQSSADSQRPAGDHRRAQRRLAPIGVFTVVGVIWFMVVVGWVADLI